MPNLKTKLHEDDEKPDNKLKIKLAAVDETEKKIKNVKKVIISYIKKKLNIFFETT